MLFKDLLPSILAGTYLKVFSSFNRTLFEGLASKIKIKESAGTIEPYFNAEVLSVRVDGTSVLYVVIGEPPVIPMRDILIYLHEIYGGDFYKIYNHLNNKYSINYSDIINLKSIFSDHFDYVTILDSSYPKDEFQKERPFVIKNAKEEN